MGRAVRVNSQLKSHKRFAGAFRGYCQLVDNARLYCTDAVGGPPTVKLNQRLFILLFFLFNRLELLHKHHFKKKKKKSSAKTC